MANVDERPTIVVIPTELERQSAYYDLAALGFSAIAVGWLKSNNLEWWWALPLVVIIGLWTLSGEPAADVQGVGVIAAGLRSKMGLRRSHEWLLAWGHYWKLAVWPEWKAKCVAFYRSPPLLTSR
jgi:hypothetical protein